MRLAQAVDFNSRLSEPYETLSGTSIVRGYVGPVKQGVDWLCAERPPHAPLRSPFADVKSRAPRKARPAAQRDSLSVEQMNAIFREAVRRSAAAERWLPLLAVLTGARLSELVNLQSQHVVQVGGVWALDLRKVKRAKTHAAKREIILHRVLEETGFVSWARARKGFLFDRLHRAKNPSGAASKRVLRLMRAAGVSGKEFVFHSTRHTAKDWLKDAKIDSRDVKLQIGHAFEGVSEKYGKKALRPEDRPQFVRAKLPKGLDLSPYMKSRSPGALDPALGTARRSSGRR
jgi:integrase